MLTACITLSAFRDGPTTVVQIEVLLRSCDPMDEVVLALFGRRPEDAFGIATWHNLADWFGVDATAALEQVCVDRMRQRKNAGNVRRMGVAPGRECHSRHLRRRSRRPEGGDRSIGGRADVSVVGPRRICSPPADVAASRAPAGPSPDFDPVALFAGGDTGDVADPLPPSPGVDGRQASTDVAADPVGAYAGPHARRSARGDLPGPAPAPAGRARGARPASRWRWRRRRQALRARGDVPVAPSPGQLRTVRGGSPPDGRRRPRHVAPRQPQRPAARVPSLVPGRTGPIDGSHGRCARRRQTMGPVGARARRHGTRLVAGRVPARVRGGRGGGSLDHRTRDEGSGRDRTTDHSRRLALR